MVKTYLTNHAYHER